MDQARYRWDICFSHGSSEVSLGYLFFSWIKRVISGIFVFLMDQARYRWDNRFSNGSSALSLGYLFFSWIRRVIAEIFVFLMDKARYRWDICFSNGSSALSLIRSMLCSGISFCTYFFGSKSNMKAI